MINNLLRCSLFYSLLFGFPIMTLAQVASDPLSGTRVMSLVVGGVLDENVIAEVNKHGLSFQPTEAYLTMLRQSGAGETLLRTMRQAKTNPTGGQDDAEMLNQLLQISRHLHAKEYREAALQVSAAMQKHPGDIELAFVMGNINASGRTISNGSRCLCGTAAAGT